MLFNSFAFAIFLPLVFALYWAVFNRKSVTLRNLFLLAASYVFYGWWDWRFLSLIIISSLTDFIIGARIAKINSLQEVGSTEIHASLQRKKKMWLTASIVVNIGILGFFKYYGFFVDSFIALFSQIGLHLSPSTMNIVLPVGISFYTFQTLSYTIDVYRRVCQPAGSWIQFFAFVSFFPQLVAGPIERAKNLLPQFEALKKPDYAVFRGAMLLIAWGFFKKIMIADRLAVFVEKVFDNPAAAQGMPMVLGFIFFAFQLYLDFSAYSDIAIGTSKLFGFDLMKNFNSPYLSTSFSNFWKRWHISLSSWFKDYVYIPLGGNRRGRMRTVFNVLILFAISGLWHGASWNFVIWGVLNALFMIALDPFLSYLPDKSRASRVFKAVFISLCWAVSLIFFRAKGFDTAIECFKSIGLGNVDLLTGFGLNADELKLSFALLAVVLLKEVLCEWKDNIAEAAQRFYQAPFLVRWVFYLAFVLFMVYFGQYGNGNEHSFIYFQF